MALSPSTKKKVCILLKEGKALVEQALVCNASLAFQEDADICTRQKVLENVVELAEDVIKEYEQNEDPDSSWIEVCQRFSLYCKTYQNLYDHQRVGVGWMYKLFLDKKGGVLGDDSGLGKTVQVIAFLSGLFDKCLAKTVLIVVPVSLLPNWSLQFEKWCPSIDVHDHHAQSRNQKALNLNRVQRRGGVILTSYRSFLHNCESFTSHEGTCFAWDYAIVDEGENLKNPRKWTQALHKIAARNRLVLTRTPLQNNLTVLWAVFNFTHQGTLLGPNDIFKLKYETPIAKGRKEGANQSVWANACVRALSKETAGNLLRLIQPYYLCRTKDVLNNQSAGGDSTSGLQNLKHTAGHAGSAAL